MPNKTITLVLADDHQVVRKGLQSMLSGFDDMHILGQAASGCELLDLLNHCKPDVIILDIELPDCSGLDLIQQVHQASPESRILILSMYTGEEFIFKSISEGANGYLPKNTSREELAEAIRTVYSGKEYYNPQVAGIILNSYVNKARQKNQVKGSLDELTRRETEILTMLAEGVPNQVIASKLFISIRTVESHKSHIMQKLDLHSTAQLVRFAIREKLISV